MSPNAFENCNAIGLLSMSLCEMLHVSPKIERFSSAKPRRRMKRQSTNSKLTCFNKPATSCTTRKRARSEENEHVNDRLECKPECLNKDYRQQAKRFRHVSDITACKIPSYAHQKTTVPIGRRNNFSKISDVGPSFPNLSCSSLVTSVLRGQHGRRCQQNLRTCAVA